VAAANRKRAACVQRGTELAGERDAIALAACTGDAKAAKRLAEIHAAIAAQSSELAAFNAAKKSAGEKLASAQQVEAQAAARQKAEETQKLVHETGKCFDYLDRHLNEAARALIAIDTGFAQLRRAGVVISDTQDRIGITTIIQSWAHRIPRRWHEQLRDNFQFLAPGARRTAVEHWRAIQLSFDRQAAGEPPAAKAPALQKPDARDRQDAAAAAREFLTGG
jgi:hypothetical protein